MCLLKNKERYIHYNIVHFLHKAECNHCLLTNPLRLIYTAITYRKRCVCFKQCNRHCPHISMRPLHWHDCEAIHPLEGSAELSVSDDNKYADRGGGRDNVALKK